MRWPFRRSSGVNSGSATQVDQPEQLDATPTRTPPSQAVAAQAEAWRDLPGMSLLGAMPSATDTGFSQSLPSRWRTPPALGPLGHEVRTDVPGGLVSGVARTVDPLDTRPADFVWRIPEPAGPVGGPEQPPAVRALTPAATPRTAPAPAVASQASPPSTPPAPAPQIGSAGDENVEIRPLSSARPLSALAPTAQPAQEFVPPSPPIPGDAAASTGSDSDPLAPAQSDTPQARQALPDAATAVEARDPRPVPADVTDGPTAAAPDRGVNAEPAPGTPESPPGFPAAGSGTEFTLREARSGPDPQGSAPTVAPLISRSPLPRSSAQPLIAGPTTSSPGSAADAVDRPASATSPVLPRLSSDEPTSPQTSDLTPSNEAGEPAAAVPDQESPAPGALTAASEAAADSPASVTYAAQPEPTQAQAQAQAQTQAPEPGDAASPPMAQPAATEPVSAAPIQPTRTAPIVSATRFLPASTPISVLRPPTAPVDQPVREAESVVGGYATAATLSPVPGASTEPAAVVSGAAPFGQTSAAPPIASSSASAATAAARAAATTIAGNPPSRRAASPERSINTLTRTVGAGLGALAAPASAIEEAVSAAGSAGAIASGSAPAAPTTATTAAVAPHDPAALDALARQLYGRFSRHLAGELLIDRERSQFLTDLH
jgi:hypothetical protein